MTFSQKFDELKLRAAAGEVCPVCYSDDTGALRYMTVGLRKCVNPWHGSSPQNGVPSQGDMGGLGGKAMTKA